jgi:sugar lactone lactonase YvrE
MKTHHPFLPVSVLLLTACAAKPPSVPAPAVPLVVTGLAQPESAIHDPVTDVYLVSNLSGSPLEPDHDGFISRISPDGRVLALRFIDGARSPQGLSAPKGLALVGRTVYVTDIDRVRSFDADTGEPRLVVPVPGAVFLNDAAPGPDGAIFVTDTGLRDLAAADTPSEDDALFAIRGDSVRRVASGAGLGHPNGVLWAAGKVELVTLGSGEWLTLTAEGSIVARTKLPGGALDGLVRLDDGTLLASSWATSSLYRLAPDRRATLAASGLPSPADIGYDQKRGVLLIPEMMENRLVIRGL